MTMKKAKIKFSKDNQCQFWNVEVIDAKTKEVIYKSREKFDYKTSTEEKIDYMRKTIGKTINEKGYCF